MRYNKSAFNHLVKARQHIFFAMDDLKFGCLQLDFEEQIKQLNELYEIIRKVIEKETEIG